MSGAWRKSRSNHKRSHTEQPTPNWSWRKRVRELLITYGTMGRERFRRQFDEEFIDLLFMSSLSLYEVVLFILLASIFHLFPFTIIHLRLWRCFRNIEYFCQSVVNELNDVSFRNCSNSSRFICKRIFSVQYSTS